MKSNQLIQFWKNWMNRNRSFSKPEMEELESHLWAEIDEIVVTEGCTEEEAFAKTVVNMGSENRISQDFIKTKPSFGRAFYFIKNNSLFIIASLLCVIVFLVFDTMFAQTHSFQDYVSISEKQYISLQKTQTEFSEYYPDKPFFAKSSTNSWYFSFISEEYTWFSTSPFYRETLPEYAGISLSPKLTFVIDNMRQLWVEQGFAFDQNSLRLKNLKPRKVKKISYPSFPSINESLRLPPAFMIYLTVPSGESKQVYPVKVTEKDITNKLVNYVDESGTWFVKIDLSGDDNYRFDKLNNDQIKNQLSLKDTTSSSIVLALQSFEDALPVKTEYLRVELLQVKYGFGDIETNEYVLSTEYVDVVQKPQHIVSYLMKHIFK